MKDPGYRLTPNVPTFFWNAGTNRWDVVPEIPVAIAEQAKYSGSIRIPKDPDHPDGDTIPCIIFKVSQTPQPPVPHSLGNSQWAQRAPMEAPKPEDVESDKPEVQVQTAAIVARIAERISRH